MRDSDLVLHRTEETPRHRRPVWSRRSAGLAYTGLAGQTRYGVLRRLLASADLATATVAAVILAVPWASAPGLVVCVLIAVPAWLMLAKLLGLYDRDQRSLRHLAVDELPAVVVWVMTGTLATSLTLAASPLGAPGLAHAVFAGAAAAAVAVALRSLARLAWRRLTSAARTVIVGEGALADATRRKLELFPDIHVDIVGEFRTLTIDDLQNASDGVGAVDGVIVTGSAIDPALFGELVGVCRRRQMELRVIPAAPGMFGTAVRLHHIADLPVLQHDIWDVSRSTLLMKRVMDIVGSSIALLIASPVFALVALAIAVESGRPVIFAQHRAGLKGCPFRMLKFRTMVTNAEEVLSDLVPFDSLSEPMFKLPGDPRVTRVGRFLRRTSLDELPQLVNVLKGDMGLVGPRPEQIELVARYRPEHLFRLDVKPGITGPMQVFGRGNLTFEERLAVEREYVENVSIGRDLRILALTISTVANGRGAY